MVGCHHQLDGDEFEQAMGAGDDIQNMEVWHAAVPWGQEELDLTE